MVVAEQETITHTVRVSKDAGRQLNDDKMRAQVDQILAGVNTPTRLQKGWRTDLRTTGLNRGWYNQNYAGNGYLYSVVFDVSIVKPRRDPRVLEVEFQNILNSIDLKGKSLPGNPWEVKEVDDAEYIPKSASENSAEQNNAEIGYAPIRVPENWDEFFEHLYGLDPHIARAKRAILNAIETDFGSRIHTLFVGPPGCGKSDICKTIKTALGEDCVMEFDATSTTMAGAQKELGEREDLPRVMLIEEIEKATTESMQFLLSILDLRGEVRKVTARGNIMRDTKMVAIATCNDYELLKRQGAGALASRFGKPVYFRRPSRELLEKILRREVDRFGGKYEWVAPTLDFCEKLNTTDPREVIGHMMCGRDDLLDGTYQSDVWATSAPEDSFPDLGAELERMAMR